MSLTSVPPMETPPSPTSQWRAISRAIVDLPEPLGPTSAVNVPAGASKEISWSTSVFPS